MSGKNPPIYKFSMNQRLDTIKWLMVDSLVHFICCRAVAGIPMEAYTSVHSGNYIEPFRRKRRLRLRSNAEHEYQHNEEHKLYKSFHT